MAVIKQANTQASETALLPEFGKIAFYLRLSMADGDLGEKDKDESNSIENQRLLLQDYLLRKIQQEMYGVDDSMDATDTTLDFDAPMDDPTLRPFLDSIFEYVDDGYSGTNFDRPGFKAMIEDAKSSKINTILVKDTSRLGRDYIEVGDYMEQIFPRLGIRLIAVNTNYDSAKYTGVTMGLETSMMNFIYAEYSRDQSRKVTSAVRAMWAQGIPTSSRAPFGYTIKDKKYVVDPEAAEYVKLIFEKARTGWTTSMIANYLNDEGIPAPGLYLKEKTGLDSRGRKVPDSEWLWDTGKIHRIIRNYSYTGNMVHGKRRAVTPCSKSRRAVDENERFILKGTHEALVSEEDWEDAQAAVTKQRKPAYRSPSGFALQGKVRCGCCGLAMNYAPATGSVSCRHSASAGVKSACDRTIHDGKHILSIVGFELNRQMGLLEKLGLKIEEGRKEKAAGYRALKTDSGRQTEILKAEKTRQYEAYATGVISREAFIRKRDEIDGKIKEMSEKLERASKIEGKERGLLNEIHAAERTANQIREDEGKDKGRGLTRAMVDAFIDTVWIYDKDHMEVRFTFDDLGRRAIDYLEERGKEI